MANELIRDVLKVHGMTFWQLADLLGKSEATITRMMRHQLPTEQRDEIIRLILKKGAKND